MRWPSQLVATPSENRLNIQTALGGILADGGELPLGAVAACVGELVAVHAVMLLEIGSMEARRANSRLICSVRLARSGSSVGVISP